jgi:hypothetical protein
MNFDVPSRSEATLPVIAMLLPAIWPDVAMCWHSPVDEIGVGRKLS